MLISRQKVDYISHMGSDLTVVNAARVSFSKESEAFSDKDAKLIAYLAKHNHWTPFGHCFIQFRIKAPIFVARQLVKHQVGLVWNEESRRYIDSDPEFYFPNSWRARPDGSIKQGSSGLLESDRQINWELQIYSSSLKCLKVYKAALEDGMAPEQARMFLPLNTMTEWYWSGSLAAFARVCKLRLDPHAQEETREIAEKISNICTPLFPVSWKELMND